MIYELVIPQFTKMLGNLVAILDEAEKYAGEKKFDSGVLQAHSVLDTGDPCAIAINDECLFKFCGPVEKVLCFDQFSIRGEP